MEENFARKMKDKKGFHIRAMEEDGSCLFRAVGKIPSKFRLDHSTLFQFILITIFRVVF